jgi:hypothetical protein
MTISSQPAPSNGFRELPFTRDISIDLNEIADGKTIRGEKTGTN